MSSRDEILATLRAARNASQSAAPSTEVPRDYRLEGDDSPGSAPVLAEFVEKLEDYNVEVHRITTDAIPETISSVLDARGAESVVVPAGLDSSWTEAAGAGNRLLRVDSAERPLSKDELDATHAVVTASRTAVSLSGTIILDGEADQGRRIITLLPDLHLCVVNASAVQATVPQAVSIIGENPTRPTTWIAGGSATSDIELVRVDGVHGPRSLVVLLIEDL